MRGSIVRFHNKTGRLYDKLRYNRKRFEQKSLLVGGAGGDLQAPPPCMLIGQQEVEFV